MLYSENTLDFKNVSTIILFPKTILTRRLNIITTLHFSWWYTDRTERNSYSPHDEKIWEECWGVVAAMKGLRELRVSIQTCRPRLDAQSERLLEPLCAVRGPKVFEVDAPWLEYAADYRDAPFVFAPSETWLETQTRQSLCKNTCHCCCFYLLYIYVKTNFGDDGSPAVREYLF